MPPDLVVRTARLHLCPFTVEDTAKVFAMSREAGMGRWIPNQVYANEQVAREVLDFLIGHYRDATPPTRGPCVLGIRLAATDELIGHVGLNPLPEGVEIGYAIEEARQGNGFATEAVRAMSEWGVVRFSLPRIVGLVAPENTRSCRVLEKAGYRPETEGPRMMHGRIRPARRYLFPAAQPALVISGTP